MTEREAAPTTDSRLVLVAQLAGPFGVRGEVRVTAFTQDPMNLLDYGPLLDAASHPALTLLSGRPDKNTIVGRAKEIATREEAQAMRGLRLYIPRDRLPAPEEDEFYLADLIGMTAVALTGEAIGRVKSVHNFGAGDLLEIEPMGGSPTWWAPFNKAIVPEVRLADGLVVIDRPAEIEDTADERG